MGSDVRDVGDPVRVRRGHVELPIQQVWCDRRRLPAVVSRTAPIAHLGAQALDPHQPINAMPATALAQITKVAGHLAMAVDRAAFQPGLFDQPEKPLVAALAIALRLRQPCIEAAARRLEHAAHRCDPELVLVRLHERVLRLQPLAKYAAAFFRLSRSSVTRFSSA